MNSLQIFNNKEFGNVRAVIMNDLPWFVGKDVCEAFGGTNYRRSLSNIDESDKGVSQNDTLINERIEKLHRFKHWVTSEVLPSIRKNGSYNKPMTTAEKIHLLAQGNEELNERVDKVEDKITSIEEETPLYGCEIEEVQKHVRKKGIEVLGGKDSNAYKDGGIRGSVYSDIYKQLKREFGCVATYKSIKRKYLADVHEFIDCYLLPIVLAEVVNTSNALNNF